MKHGLIVLFNVPRSLYRVAAVELVPCLLLMYSRVVPHISSFCSEFSEVNSRMYIRISNTFDSCFSQTRNWVKKLGVTLGLFSCRTIQCLYWVLKVFRNDGYTNMILIIYRISISLLLLIEPKLIFDFCMELMIIFCWLTFFTEWQEMFSPFPNAQSNTNI